MKMRIRKKNVQAKIIVGMVMILTAGGWFSGAATAASSIAARYIQPRGDQISWKIRVPSPPPAAVIVIQYILPGSEILESSHPLSSYDKEKGVAKWLINSISPGILRMEMKISKPIRKKGEIHGEVLFQDESQNTTDSIFMKPRAVKKAFEGC